LKTKAKDLDIHKKSRSKNQNGPRLEPRPTEPSVKIMQKAAKKKIYKD